MQIFLFWERPPQLNRLRYPHEIWGSNCAKILLLGYQKLLKSVEKPSSYEQNHFWGIRFLKKKFRRRKTPTRDLIREQNKRGDATWPMLVSVHRGVIFPDSQPFKSYNGFGGLRLDKASS